MLAQMKRAQHGSRFRYGDTILWVPRENLGGSRAQFVLEQVDELVSVKAAGRRIKVCEDCAERLAEEAEIAEMSESAMQDMMGYKGRR